MKIFISVSGVTEERWAQMTNAQKKAYLKKYPNSKYATKKVAGSKTGAKGKAKDANYDKLMDQLSDVEADMEELRDEGKTSSRAYKALEAKQSQIETKLSAYKKSKPPKKPSKAKPTSGRLGNSLVDQMIADTKKPESKIFYYKGLIRESEASIKERTAELADIWDEMNPSKRPTLSAFKAKDKRLANAKRKIVKYKKLIEDLSK